MPHWRLTPLDSPQEATREVLARILERGLADAVLVARWLPGGGILAPSLITSSQELADADPWAPYMGVNAAGVLSALTRRGAEGRVAAVLRPCELRALTELAKLNQVALPSILTIGIDCLGTYEVEDFQGFPEKGKLVKGHLLLETSREVPFRTACRICQNPAPHGADISLQYLGREGILYVEAGEELGKSLGLEEEEKPEGREEALARIVGEQTEAREKALSEFREKIAGPRELLAELSACIRCHNCTIACPLCYCRECLFRTPAFEHQGWQYLEWARRRGAIRMPSDTLLFHLTRLAHMATSCVGCGMCQSACPHKLPLTLLFQGVGERLQALFGYIPGRDLREALPLATFREEELEKLAK